MLLSIQLLASHPPSRADDPMTSQLASIGVQTSFEQVLVKATRSRSNSLSPHSPHAPAATRSARRSRTLSPHARATGSEHRLSVSAESNVKRSVSPSLMTSRSATRQAMSVGECDQSLLLQIRQIGTPVTSSTRSAITPAPLHSPLSREPTVIIEDFGDVFIAASDVTSPSDGLRLETVSVN